MFESKSELARELATAHVPQERRQQGLYRHYARCRQNDGFGAEVKQALRVELEPPLNLHTLEVMGQYLAHILTYHPDDAGEYEEELGLYLKEIIGVYGSSESLMALAASLLTHHDVICCFERVYSLTRIPAAIDHEPQVFNHLQMITDHLLWQFEVWKVTLPTLVRDSNQLFERFFSFVEDQKPNSNKQLMQFKVRMVLSFLTKAPQEVVDNFKGAIQTVLGSWLEGYSVGSVTDEFIELVTEAVKLWGLFERQEIEEFVRNSQSHLLMTKSYLHLLKEVLSRLEPSDKDNWRLYVHEITEELGNRLLETDPNRDNSYDHKAAMVDVLMSSAVFDSYFFRTMIERLTQKVGDEHQANLLTSMIFTLTQVCQQNNSKFFFSAKYFQKLLGYFNYYCSQPSDTLYQGNPQVTDATLWDLLTLRTIVKHKGDIFLKKEKPICNLVIRLSCKAVSNSALLHVCQEIVESIYESMQVSFKTGQDSVHLSMEKITYWSFRALRSSLPEKPEFFSFLLKIWNKKYMVNQGKSIENLVQVLRITKFFIEQYRLQEDQLEDCLQAIRRSLPERADHSEEAISESMAILMWMLDRHRSEGVTDLIISIIGLGLRESWPKQFVFDCFTNAFKQASQQAQQFLLGHRQMRVFQYMYGIQSNESAESSVVKEAWDTIHSMSSDEELTEVVWFLGLFDSFQKRLKAHQPEMLEDFLHYQAIQAWEVCKKWQDKLRCQVVVNVAGQVLNFCCYVSGYLFRVLKDYGDVTETESDSQVEGIFHLINRSLEYLRIDPLCTTFGRRSNTKALLKAWQMLRSQQIAIMTQILLLPCSGKIGRAERIKLEDATKTEASWLKATMPGPDDSAETLDLLQKLQMTKAVWQASY